MAFIRVLRRQNTHLICKTAYIFVSIPPLYFQVWCDGPTCGRGGSCACGSTILRHEFTSINNPKEWTISQDVVWKRAAMAAFAGHVVWHVLCRRDKVRDLFRTTGFSANHRLKTTCLLMAIRVKVGFQSFTYIYVYRHNLLGSSLPMLKVDLFLHLIRSFSDNCQYQL